MIPATIRHVHGVLQPEANVLVFRMPRTKRPAPVAAILPMLLASALRMRVDVPRG
jgi:hypothetical protein